MIKKILFVLLGIVIIGMMAINFYSQPISDTSQQVTPTQNNNKSNENNERLPSTANERERIEEETNTVASEFVQPAFSLAMEEMIDSVLAFFANSETHIVAIGDSLTQGVGDETDGGGYVGILDRTINQHASIAEIDNYGKRGNRSDQLLHRLDNEEIVASIQDADVILITIGANDIMQVAKENILNLELNDFIEERVHYEQRLNRIVEQITDLNQTASIYLIGFYNPFEQYFRDIKELGMIVDAYNQTGIDIAKKETNIIYIPTIDLFRDPETELFAEDNFHPSYEGYRRIAERVLEYITIREDERHVEQ